MQNVDTLIVAAQVLPIEPEGVVLQDHAVAIAGGRIVAIAPAAEALASYNAGRIVHLNRHVLMPGLVNLHCHAAMTLMRGMADDLPLMTWLQERVWPAEGTHVGDDFVHDGSLLAAAEMLRGGITCVNDMYFFPGATARAMLRAGMRASLGIIAIEFPSAYAPDAAGYLTKGLATLEAYRGEPTLTFCLAPHAPYTVGDETLRKIATLAEELDVPIHTHVHETRDEITQEIERHKMRPLQRLHLLGLVSPRLIAVHAVHLDESDLDLLAREGASVAHCPASNLKLASGIAPVAAMLARGINVGVGTDGAASNNRLDLFSEMRLASLLAKGASGDARALDAHATLRMATLGGARALGLDDSIGSLRPGKWADLTAVELSALETLPCFDVASHLAYVTGREHVSHVWVGGEARVTDGELVGIDEPQLRDKANWWKQRLANP